MSQKLLYLFSIESIYNYSKGQEGGWCLIFMVAMHRAEWQNHLLSTWLSTLSLGGCVDF